MLLIRSLIGNETKKNQQITPNNVYQASNQQINTTNATYTSF